MIICTEKDNNYYLYKDAVKERKVKFHIKDIFIEHWDNYKIKFANRKRRPIIDKIINKFLSCKNINLGWSIYRCPICHEEMVYYKCYHT